MNAFHSRSLYGMLLLLLLGLLAFFPAQSAQGITQGLVCCGQRVIPALFPFFVISDLLMSSPAAGWLGVLARPYTRFGLGIRDKEAPAALILSWLGGFAVAAKTVSRLYEDGRVSRSQAELLLVCAVGSSPAFVVNTVGLLMLHSVRLGICLFFALFLSSLACGLLIARIFPFPSTQAFCRKAEQKAVQPAGLVPAVGRAVSTTLTVCGFVLFFSCVSNCLQTVLAQLVPISPAARFVSDAFLEVTGGCLSGSRLPAAFAPIACCTALSILSLSVFLQVRALASRELSLDLLLWSRPLHLAFSLLFLRLLLRFVPASSDVISTLADQVISQSRLAPDSALVLFALCCLVLRFTSGSQWTIMVDRKKPAPCGGKTR